jgi:hypothetical protein
MTAFGARDSGRGYPVPFIETRFFQANGHAFDRKIGSIRESQERPETIGGGGADEG